MLFSHSDVFSGYLHTGTHRSSSVFCSSSSTKPFKALPVIEAVSNVQRHATVKTPFVISACALLACLNNPDPALSGEGTYQGVDLVGDDAAKPDMHSNVYGSANYENSAAGLAYVRYEP
ncbi:hypothetical protein DAEQUDRAFT_496154 [Daedalea quercina L-15889]|uniref:Uncharacterized protein n=1 Tax=Daedalea quercina L-15889 TaxID=1314783 RepID=A0A165MKR9_9APHY|nr:hypothetical protein DAEQUDRAFT_496154 [Daedalea quercina L-15889]